MENKPGEMKCFAWKIDFSLPGNKLSVPRWPFDLLCLFEFAEVSYFIFDTFRHGSTHYLEIFLSYSITSAALTNIYRVNVVPQLWLIRFHNDQHLSTPHHVSAPPIPPPSAHSWFPCRHFFFPPSHLLRQQLAVATGPSAFFDGGFDGRLNLVAIPQLYNVKINMSPFVHECLCNVKSLLYNWAEKCYLFNKSFYSHWNFRFLEHPTRMYGKEISLNNRMIKAHVCQGNSCDGSWVRLLLPSFVCWEKGINWSEQHRQHWKRTVQ